MDNDSQPFSQPRPLFLYGTLRAMPLLAWALTGDPTRIDFVKPLVQPAQVRGYARFSLYGKDYPAIIERSDNTVAVDGLLLRPQTHSQRRKLDDFEGETYQVVAVTVRTLVEGGGLELVDADLYLWNGDSDAMMDKEWDLDVFIRERLDDWLDLFSGMELVGDEVGG